MVIGIFGESCTGKSTLAAKLGAALGAKVVTGKDWLRLAKDENTARQLFKKELAQAMEGAHMIYVIAEKEHLPLLPAGALRVLATADMAVIKTRFAQRMGGHLPPPVAAMLERKHGGFDLEPHDVHYCAETDDPQAVCEAIAARL